MKKMVTCKTCGAEIAKSASVCPKCGAKQHQGAYAACAVIIVLTIIVCAFGILGSGESSPPNSGSSSNSSTEISASDPSADVSASEPPVEVTAKELWAAYSENEVSADDTYKGKILSISGTIRDITADVLTDDPCVVLDSGDTIGVYGIQCFFTDKESRDSVAKLADGQEVTLTGKCTGKNIVVRLTNCKLDT